MQQMIWDEEVNNGLQQAAQKSYPVLEELERINERGQLAKASRVDVVRYDSQEQDNPQGQIVTLTMKRYFAAGGFTTFCVVVIAAAEQGAFAAAASIGGMIAAVGVGLGVAFIALRWCVSFSPAAESRGQGASAGPQNINVVVNVAGSSVTTNTNTK